ncbi:MAG: fused MFS/spermidine synthase [Solobacterium sp.]|nr:fused MFS/spermidine synthase [Solobacterium sp.]
MPQEDQEIRLYEMEYADGRQARIYENGEVMHSAAYTEEGCHYDLVFDYMKTMNVIFDLSDSIHDILLIGGAGYSYPKYVISRYPDIRMDVVDIDPMAFETAKMYFYLDELIRDFDLENNRRLIPVTDDGRHYLETTEKTYDVIINDAYNGIVPVVSLITAEACRTVKSRLRENGMYVINVPGYKRMKKSKYMLDVIASLQTVFRSVIVIRAAGRFAGSYTCNYIVAASDCYDKAEGMLKYDLNDASVITDENAESIEENYHF